jgi:hypothetical protein
LRLVWCIEVALVAGWLLRREVVYPNLRLVVAVALIAINAQPRIPHYVRGAQTVEAIATLARGEDPVNAPPGCEHRLQNRERLYESRDRPRSLTWEDYRDALNYLRRTTTPETPVANFLLQSPFPAINGPIGRLTPFPAAGGVHWLRGIVPGDELKFAQSLERSPDAVVVWVPPEVRPKDQAAFPLIAETIVRHYRRAVRFGVVGIWTRAKPDDVPPPPPPDGSGQAAAVIPFSSARASARRFQSLDHGTQIR